MVRDGEILATAAIDVGGRLVAFDADERMTRIEPSARLVADAAGHPAGARAARSTPRTARAWPKRWSTSCRYVSGREPSAARQRLLLTEPLDADGQDRRGVTFSGGVAEYIYGREPHAMATSARTWPTRCQRALDDGPTPAQPVPLGEGIRATVIGASQFTVQLSGNTVHISDPAVLPLRNLPVVYARLDAARPDADAVAQAIRNGFVRFDLSEGEHPAAVALPWRGEPHYANLRALADGIAQAMPDRWRPASRW